MDRRIEIHSSPKKPMPLSQQEMIDDFWRKKQVEVEEIQDFGDRAIPMTRIKRVICNEKGKMMMAFDTPSFLTKACEIFVQEIALRAWISANSQQRNIILESDIAEAIASTESYDFLNDVLNAHQDEHRSCPSPKPAKKRHDRFLTNLPSSSRHLHPHQNQLPQFCPKFSKYPPLVHIPPSVPQTYGHRIPLPLASPPHEASSVIATTVTPTPVVSGIIPPTNCMANDLVSFGNTINNIAASGVMNHMEKLPRALANIPNTYRYMNMVASASVYGADGASSTNNGAAEDSTVAFHFPYIPQITLQLPPPLQMAMTSTHNSNNITIENYIDLEVAATKITIPASSTSNGNGDIDPNAIGVCGDQHQHEEEANTSLEVNGVHGSLDAQVGVAASMGNDINWDGFEMLDDSLLPMVGKDSIMDEEPAPLPNTTSNDDLLLTGSISDLEGFSHEPYLLDDIISGAGTSKRCT
jgi:nuclear transcription factor Y gamma